jgi:hypothetical protein
MAQIPGVSGSDGKDPGVSGGDRTCPVIVFV